MSGATIPKRDAVIAAEKLIGRALAEEREIYALTDATGSRSTAKLKTAAQRAADTAYVDGLCELLYFFTDDLTPTMIRWRLAAVAS